MTEATKQPCDEGVILAGEAVRPVPVSAGLWVLAATILGSSMVFINGSTVNVALPAFQRELGATVADIQWIVNAYTLFLAALILLGGVLGDRYGRRRVFGAGVVLFALASIGCGAAPTASTLIAARAVQGVGGALLTPGSLAIISAFFEDAERGRAIGLWAGFSSLTSALGPLLGGWLIDTISWRWIFYMHLPLAAIVLLITWFGVPETQNDAEPAAKDRSGGAALDWRGALLVMLGLGGLTYGLITSSERGFDDVAVWVAIVAGVALLAAFVWVESRQESPMMPLHLFRSRTFSGANGLTLLLYTALGGAFFFLPLNLIQVQGYSATAAGAALAPTILLLSLLSSWAGGLVSRVGARLPLVVGPAIAAAGFFLLSLPGIGGSYWTTFFPGLVVLGVGLAIAVAPLTTTVMSAVSRQYAGTASGINNAVARVASLLAIAGLGIVMLSVFSSALQTRMQAMDISPDDRQVVMAQRTDLANIQPPSSMAEAQQAQVERAVNEAFVDGFRIVLYIMTALALGSALIAGLTIEPGVEEGLGDASAHARARQE